MLTFGCTSFSADSVTSFIPLFMIHPEICSYNLRNDGIHTSPHLHSSTVLPGLWPDLQCQINNDKKTEANRFKYIKGLARFWFGSFIWNQLQNRERGTICTLLTLHMSPSDKHLITPYNFTTWPNIKLTRVKLMITDDSVSMFRHIILTSTTRNT